jgi:hypothetical protein
MSRKEAVKAKRRKAVRAKRRKVVSDVVCSAGRGAA